MIMPIKLRATSNTSTDVDSLSSLVEEMEYTVDTLRLDEGHGHEATALPVGTATRAKCATTETVLKRSPHAQLHPFSCFRIPTQALSPVFE
jgi:hypothetical protein